MYKQTLHKTLLHIKSHYFKCKGRSLLYRLSSHHIFPLCVLMLHFLLIICTCANNLSVRKSKALLIPPSPQKQNKKVLAFMVDRELNSKTIFHRKI